MHASFGDNASCYVFTAKGGALGIQSFKGNQPFGGGSTGIRMPKRQGFMEWWFLMSVQDSEK